MKWLLESWKDYDTGEETFDDQMDAENRRCQLLDEGADRVRIYPIITCECGEEVVCRNFTNTCECGADYNFAGQMLAPREQWGYETGENWQECY